MWVLLTITIFLMGLIAIITSVVTGRTYRDIMIDSQRMALY